MSGSGDGKDKTVIGGMGMPSPLPGGVNPMPGGKRQVSPNERTVIGGALPGAGGGFWAGRIWAAGWYASG